MHILNMVKEMPFNIRSLNWNTLFPFLCVGFLAGIISTLVPMLETLLLAAGIGALTGSLMRYCRSQSGGGSSAP